MEELQRGTGKIVTVGGDVINFSLADYKISNYLNQDRLRQVTEIQILGVDPKLAPAQLPNRRLEYIAGRSTYCPPIDSDLFFDDLIPKDGPLAHFFTDSKTERYTPQRILKSGPVTIVFWRDGTKTMVRRAPDEEDNTYAAFTAALAIKIFGSNSALKRMLKAKTEYQKDKKKSAAPDQGCTDTCPIDFDAIERNLAADMETKTAHDAGKKLADTPTGT